ncbi:hypothetical protein PYW08_006928 [Mythimna loreyi]|uniref:Uncharacterized protein n=1 Tax=Mythimna loreyi TaxID=667449 RepID=A0ACC2R8G0_9NEOP|nr:hypothetical protein PYW08_006928 [Mythimna loreyi]
MGAVSLPRTAEVTVSYGKTFFGKCAVCCDEEYRLIRHLMTRYDASVRPVENSSQPLLVTFGVSLHHIIDVGSEGVVEVTHEYTKDTITPWW